MIDANVFLQLQCVCRLLSGSGEEMEQRTQTKLRRVVDLCVRAVARGSMPLSRAARTMEAAGASFEVVCRVLLPFKDGVSKNVRIDGV